MVSKKVRTGFLLFKKIIRVRKKKKKKGKNSNLTFPKKITW